MILTEEEVRQFFRIESLVYFYANELNNLVDGFNSADDFIIINHRYKIIIRAKIYQDKKWIFDEFVKKHKDVLSQEDIEIALSWKEQIYGKFFIVKQLKNYAKFFYVKGERAYAVHGLSDSFDDITHLPCITETVLLPFKGKIIYDGLLQTQNISFGGGIRKSMQDNLSIVEAKYGLIKSLPHQAENNPNEDLLKYYAKSAKNRDYYATDIDDIISKNRELEPLYYREVGKSNARIFSKSLREKGIEKGYFAIIKDVIVASGATQKEVERNIKTIVPKEKLEYVYIYQLKKR